MKKKVRQTVIDIETYGFDTYAAIASIGIVDFFVADEFVIDDQYYATIDQTLNKKLNREYDKETLEWWKEQPKEVMKQLLVNQRPLDEVMLEVCEFIRSDALVWTQGTDFDIPIIRSTLKQLGMEVPWKFRNLRDSRTFTVELGHPMINYRDTTTHHNALEDAITQAKVINMLKRAIEKS